uniref:Synergin gamma C-terminal domain-containing protein n=1 Tax=Setaria italica TaxID=4555 RepID=K3ZHX4_SETIT
MDAVAFPPPPAPFLDDDFDFGDFTFASAPAPTAPQPALADPRPATFAAFDDDWGDFVASELGSNADASAPPTPPTATSDAAPSSWEKPRGPLPLSLFGAGDDQEEEGSAGPPPTATAPQRAVSCTTDGSRPADLKDLIAGLYGSQPSPTAGGAADAGPQEEAEDGEGIGDDDWEFTAATAEPDDQDRGGRAPGDGMGKIELSLPNCHEMFGVISWNDSILNLYKESVRADVIHIEESSAESMQNSYDLFSNNEMAAQKVFTLSGENRKATAIGREIQEIYDKLKDSSLPNGFWTEEHPRDVCITELLNCIKEEQLKDFEQEYCLAEKISRAIEDTSVAVELYKHSVSTLHTLELASRKEQGDYVGAWYSMLLPCAQELQYGAAIWQESCHTNVCNRVISEGGHYFIALGEIYRVAQILCFSMQCFKPWVLADPGMLSKMLVCLDRCINAWTSGLEMALKRVVDSNHVDASVAKALLESINNINELEVPSLQNFLPTNKTTCRLSLLPPSSVPGMKLIMWNGNHYIVKVANLWANWISSYPPQMSRTPVIEEQRSNTWQSY